jgi:hypothetical protein
MFAIALDRVRHRTDHRRCASPGQAEAAVLSRVIERPASSTALVDVLVIESVARPMPN